MKRIRLAFIAIVCALGIALAGLSTLPAPAQADTPTRIDSVTINVAVPAAGSTNVEGTSILSLPSDAHYTITSAFWGYGTGSSGVATYPDAMTAGSSYYLMVQMVADTGYYFPGNMTEADVTINGTGAQSHSAPAITNVSTGDSYGYFYIKVTPQAAATPRVWFEATTGGNIEAWYAISEHASKGTTVSAGNKSELANMFYGYSPASGETIELTAKPASGYRFIGWYKAWDSTNPVVVSTSATYRYKVPTSGETLTAVFKSGGKVTSYIDNTVDKSKSYVTGVVYLAGEVGKEEGYDPEKTVYTNEASVTYSDPKSATVQGMIDAAYTQVYNLAKACKEKGDRGEFNMSTSESTGKEWDDRVFRVYTWDGTKWVDGVGNTYSGTVSDNPSPNDGDSLVISTGDYGKYTYYRVEANGWVGRDHTHTLVKTDKVEPTCTTAGTEAYWTCSECNKMFSDEAGTQEITEPVEIAATGHNWGEWTETKAATCTETGTEERVCKNDASHVETRELAALGHSWDEGVTTTEPTCTETGEKLYTCTVCGEAKTETIPALGHSWGEWEVVKEATETEEGLRRRTCTVCGEVEEELIPVIKKEETKVVPKVVPKTTTPNTGEPASMAGLVAAVGGALALVGSKRRKK